MMAKFYPSAPRTAGLGHTIMILGLIALLTVATVGCGGPADQPALAPVRGTVLVDGQPRENLQIEFSPESGRKSIGLTDANGQYELTYIRTTKGAKIGKHKVQITTMQTSDSDREVESTFNDPIPASYNKKTTLEREVTSGPNTFDFEINTKAT